MMLSKTKYLHGIKCHKMLWLDKHKYEFISVCEDQPEYITRGRKIEELARKCFPKGEFGLIEENPGFKSVDLTQELLSKGVKTIYEAMFFFNDTFVVADILQQKKGKWYLYEIKSTQSVKPEHLIDVAVQYYVINGSGFPLSDVFVMHVNPKSKGARNDYFTKVSVLDQILPLQQEVEKNIPILLSVIKHGEPHVEMGEHCLHPYCCEFFDYCNFNQRLCQAGLQLQG